MPVHLATPIEKLTRVGKVTAQRFTYLGIHTVKDLLEHYPYRCEDYTTSINLNSLAEGATGTIQGTITSIQAKKTSKKRMLLTQATIENETGSIDIVWFNQPYIADTLSEGNTIAVSGTVTRSYKDWTMTNPTYEKVDEGNEHIHTGSIIPIYPLTAGITQKQIRFLMHQALEAISEYPLILPEEIRVEQNMPTKHEALRALHAPQSQDAYEQALTSLKFEELFIIQLLVLHSKKQSEKVPAPSIPFDEEGTKALVASLPFTLTDDQKRVAWQIIQDMHKKHPMNRLVQGDVGSGKTVVASLAALNAAHAGYQTVLMAPTEILALQHYQTITALFPDKQVALLTSQYARMSTEEDISKKDIIQNIEKGDIPIVVGTHALIQKEVTFHALGLVIIDEQHRFGVEQRKTLKTKEQQHKDVPHFLSMTATPIPRTLALTLYGDLAIATIRQMPKNRKPIQTKYVLEQKRKDAYTFMKKQMDAGRQIFVVCPLIEESDALGVTSATQTYDLLRKTIFKNSRIALLHGKMKSKEKEEIMQSFKQHKTDMLVTTAVVEVGVDVPNATVMMIEGADRFGLAQLHQFRGRVGRGEHQSYCFLFSESNTPYTKERLTSFTQAPDGFAIAELDLQLRGHGNIYGTEQSGHMEHLHLASLSDTTLIEQAQTCAENLYEKDATLKKHPQLQKLVAKEIERLHFE